MTNFPIKNTIIPKCEIWILPKKRTQIRWTPNRKWNNICAKFLIFFFGCLISQDGTYVQKLVTPNSEHGMKRTVQNLLDDFSTPAKKASKFVRFLNSICCRKYTIRAVEQTIYRLENLTNDWIDFFGKLFAIWWQKNDVNFDYKWNFTHSKWIQWTRLVSNRHRFCIWNATDCLSAYGQMMYTHAVVILVSVKEKNMRRKRDREEKSHMICRNVVKQCREWEIIFFLPFY